MMEVGWCFSMGADDEVQLGEQLRVEDEAPVIENVEFDTYQHLSGLRLSEPGDVVGAASDTGIVVLAEQQVGIIAPKGPFGLGWVEEMGAVVGDGEGCIAPRRQLDIHREAYVLGAG